MKHLTIKASQAGQRFDQIAAGWLGITRSQAARSIRTGELTLNAHLVKVGELVATGDWIDYSPLARDITLPQIPIIYEDADLLVVDKPAGLVVHPTGSHHQQATLVDFAKAHSNDPDPVRPGIVHRLDKDTSGLVIIAKNPVAKVYLQRLFAGRKVEKDYLVLVSGRLPRSRAEINLPIGAGVGIRRRVDPSGRVASTHYEVIKTYATATYIKASPKSGRTHQLRVHFAAIGHAIVGDELYGQAEPRLGRQFLHAHKLGFRTPGGKWLELVSRLPQALKDYLVTLE